MAEAKKERKKRDQGEPRVWVRFLPATPERVEQTRRNRQYATETGLRELYGHPVKVTIHWDEPEAVQGYWKARTEIEERNKRLVSKRTVFASEKQRENWYRFLAGEDVNPWEK